MKTIIQYLICSILFLLFVYCLQSCATNEKFINRTYHDITSLYNPYFLVKKRIDSVETDVFNKRVDNYNRILEVVPFPDTSALKPYDAIMNKNVKYASIVKNRHENSKYLDASYILVGKARFFLRDNENAINTLKYVNTKAKADKDKNRALVELLHIYTVLKDDKAVRTVLSVLSKKKLDKAEKKDFFVYRGDYFRRQNEWIETAKSLGSAVKVMKKGEKRARMYFILGQLYQKLEKNNLAAKNYRTVLKNNPKYELTFYAKLYGAQAKGLENPNDIKKTEKFFKKMLSDEKNKEYKDKIYYEIGLFHLSQKKLTEAISNLRESVAVSNNPIQKAYSYLKLGEIHYSPLQDYEKAKVYYDSTVASMPKDVEEYKSIEKRQKTLEKFVEYLSTYRTQDSLQRMAKMKEPDLGEYLQKMLTFQEIKKQKEQDSIDVRNKKLAQEKTKEEKNTLNEATNAQKGGGFYFDNPTNIQRGQQEFIKKWGKRPLEDNWRRSNKLITSDNQDAVVYEEVNPDSLKMQEVIRNVTARKKEIYELLPKTESQIIASDKLIEDAAYEIGKLYLISLEEPHNAIKYFDILLNRFPKTKYEPEVLYLLYLAHQKLEQKDLEEISKRKLVEKYPTSTYARRVLNPDYLTEARENEQAIKDGYKKAFQSYELGKNEEALAQLDKTTKAYPENLMEDKFVLLRLMVEFKIDKDKAKFKRSLEAFAEKYPQTDLQEYIKSLLAVL